MADLAAGAPQDLAAILGELEGWRIGLGLKVGTFVGRGTSGRLGSWKARRLFRLLAACGAQPEVTRRPGTGAGYEVGWNAGGDPGKRSGRHSRIFCRGVIRGATLAGGYLADPEHGYHWEWALEPDAAIGLLQCLRHLSVSAHEALGRRRGIRLYIEDGETIGCLLRELGASESVLAFENVRALRETRGRVNRVVNGETANLRRCVEAGLWQVEWIRRLDRGTLSPVLRVAAEARLARPEASLAELAAMLGTSRSALHHRLRSLVARAHKGGTP